MLDPAEQVRVAMFNAKGDAEQDPFYKWLLGGTAGDSSSGGGLGTASGIMDMVGGGNM